MTLAAVPAAPGLVVVKLPAGLDLLNANQRLHHHKRAKITSVLRGAAMHAVTEQPGLMAALAAAKPGALFDRVHILGIVHPTKRGRFDPPNWYPSFKAAIDGLVDAGLLEDDDHTRVAGPDMRPGTPVKGGQIELHIRPLPADQNWPDLALTTATAA